MKTDEPIDVLLAAQELEKSAVETLAWAKRVVEGLETIVSDLQMPRAKLLRELLTEGNTMTLREMCEFLGWQGGTIHQVSVEIGLPVQDVLKRTLNLGVRP